jgi:hypothetical protein
MFQKILVASGFLLFFSIAFVANSATPISETDQLLRRISLLEYALAPSNAEAVAVTWAAAAKNRNGAVQYMLLCPKLQNANLSKLEALNWVTGVSSPGVSDYKILSPTINGNTRKFAIQYQFAAGGGIYLSAIDSISVVPINRAVYPSQKWCINQFNYLSPVDSLARTSSK